jgi:hypothetical protein
MTQIDTRILDPDRDPPHVLELFQQVFGKPVTQALWDWKYRLPWAPEPLGWVATAGGVVVAHAGAVTLPGQIGGEECAFVQVCDVMVAEAVRSPELFHQWNPVRLAIDEASRRHRRSTIYGFTSRRLSRWYSLLGGSGSATEPADDWIVRPGAGAADSSLQFEEWTWDTPHVDAIWQRLKTSTPIGVIRDRRFLSWRYAGHPLFRYLLVGVMRNGEPIGWLVVGRPDPGQPQARVRVHDLLVPAELRLKILEQAAHSFNTEAIHVWLPANVMPASLERQKTGWQLTRVPSSGLPTSAFAGAYYTIGEADEWWW